MRKWADNESGEVITEMQLYREFTELKAALPDEFNYSFEEYILNCEHKNGSLTRV